jgi:acyl-CoA reductase-like NAD-dependent aldehyde dehydrogenase
MEIRNAAQDHPSHEVHTMEKHTITDGDLEERQYSDTEPWSRARYAESDPWGDQAVAEREAILRRWADVLEAYRRLRQL